LHLRETRIAPSKKANWIATSIPSLGALPKDTNTVKVVDTMVPALTDKNTNPTGAVSIVNYKGDSDTITYCFSVSCASCKIPLTKAKVLPPKESNDARLACDFCGATYNLRSGVQVEKEGGKLLGFLFNNQSNNEAKLPVYALGEKGGKVFISMP
jgi:nitrite reductase/ring-hydroxylating ferredoxin subunit